MNFSELDPEEVRQFLDDMRTKRNLIYDGCMIPKFLPLYPEPGKHMEVIRDFDSKESDILLCAFPKSGTHWVHEIVSMILQGGAEYSSGHKIQALLDASTIDQLNALPSPRFLNTHFAFRHLPRKHVDSGYKIIHVIRNPKDVMVSFYNHIKNDPMLACSEEDFPGTWNNFVEDMCANKHSFYGGYVNYEREWAMAKQKSPTSNIHTVFYEDLKKNPIRELKRMAVFLDKNINPGILEQIFDKCSFKKLADATTSGKKGEDIISKVSKGGNNFISRKGIEDFQNTRITTPVLPSVYSRSYGELTKLSSNRSHPYGVTMMQLPDLYRTYGRVTMQLPNDFDWTYRNRKTSLYEKCAKLKGTGKNVRDPMYFYSKSSNVAFCKAPKTGSTFIGTVVKALETKGDLVRNMFHVNRESVHGRNEATLDTLSKRNSSDLKFILVTRNPFTRLFSAYLDKYSVLGIWGKRLAKILGKDHRGMSDGFCGFNISFQDFLDYVTDPDLGDRNEDEHTLPVSSLCNPCSVRYGVICKQETLTSDTKHVLQLINITEHKRQAILEMIHGKTLKDAIFSWISSHLWYYIVYKEDCSAKALLIERLWEVLQLQGYINISLIFPAHLFKSLPVFKAEIVTKLLLQQIHSSPLTESQMYLQRTRVLQEAYDQIRPATIARIQTKFAQDFQLFSYDRSPPHI